MFDHSVYLIYRAGAFLLNLLPLSALFRLGRFGGTLAWVIAWKYRRLALRNVNLAFGDELSCRDARPLVYRHFQQLGANVVCSFKLATMPIDQILARVRIEGVEHIEACQRAGRPVVLLLSHLSCWELCAQLLPRFFFHQRKATIYQRLRNRWIDRHIRAARARFGVEMFDRSEGFGKAIALLRGGGVVGVLTDQHAGDHGVCTPFFGRLASTTPLPALLAKRTGAQLIPVAIATEGCGRWRVSVEPPIPGTGETVESLTARGNQILEAQVRRAPADWFWVHDRWKTPKPNFLLTRYKRGVYVPPGARLKPFRILIRSSNWLGDAVMSMPAVRAIKAGRPDAQVTIAVPTRMAELWREVPAVDEVIPLPLGSLIASVAEIRRRGRWDVAVLFPNSLRSALEVWLAGVPRRAGFVGHWRRMLLNQPAREKPGRGIVHQAIRYLQLATTLGAKVDGALAPAALQRRHSSPLRCGLCPGAEYGPAKRWLPERFAEVAKAISDEFGAHWVLFGTGSDAAIGAEIASILGEGCEDRIGQTSLAQLIAELRHCDLLLTNDTGTMHVAGMLGVPTISIFGSTEPRRTAPLGPARRILRHHVECSPCFLRECPLDFRCMRQLTVEEVKIAVRKTIVFLRGAT